MTFIDLKKKTVEEKLTIVPLVAMWLHLDPHTCIGHVSGQSRFGECPFLTDPHN